MACQEMTGHVPFPNHVQTIIYRSYIYYLSAIFSQVWELERFQTAKVTFKVTQGHWYWCHSI